MLCRGILLLFLHGHKTGTRGDVVGRGKSKVELANWSNISERDALVKRRNSTEWELPSNPLTYLGGRHQSAAMLATQGSYLSYLHCNDVFHLGDQLLDLLVFVNATAVLPLRDGMLQPSSGEGQNSLILPLKRHLSLYLSLSESLFLGGGQDGSQRRAEQ
ncbi:hypothetical protein Taro_055298, partial [Colocasia esculenta]|nr:hypothetical protein [Colocasia esculenta]